MKNLENGSDDLRITGVDFYDGEGNPKSEFVYGESFEMRLKYETSKRLHHPYFIVGIRKGSGHEPLVSVMNMFFDNVSLEDFPSTGEVGCLVERPNFSLGVYVTLVGVQCGASGQLGKKWYSRPANYDSFVVLPGGVRDRFPGAPSTHLVSAMPPIIMDYSWKVNGQVLRGR